MDILEAFLDELMEVLLKQLVDLLDEFLMDLLKKLRTSSWKNKKKTSEWIFQETPGEVFARICGGILGESPRRIAT